MEPLVSSYRATPERGSNVGQVNLPVTLSSPGNKATSAKRSIFKTANREEIYGENHTPGTYVENTNILGQLTLCSIWSIWCHCLSTLDWLNYELTSRTPLDINVSLEEKNCVGGWNGLTLSTLSIKIGQPTPQATLSLVYHLKCIPALLYLILIDQEPSKGSITRDTLTTTIHLTP